MSYSTHKWWKEAVVYQVYPASFKSTGSGSEAGWGDIRGVTSKLDYFKHLGVDVVWLSPICKSPQVDMGYDVSDYKDIDPKYGSLADVDELIKGLHDRGMKFMFDLVVNHTSDQHEWFKESRKSRDSPKRDWYIWQPARYDADGNRQPPNNWLQLLGDANSAWTWDETTEQYYLSLFTPEQPDLNWRTPAVREAVHDVQRFWLDRGASGFRMDVINMISKVSGYPDAPITDPNMKYQHGAQYFCNGPHLHEYLKEMHEKVLSHYDTITVGEMPHVNDNKEILRTVGQNEKELNMIFIFDLVDVDNGATRMDVKKFGAPDIRRIVTRWQKTMIDRCGWNSVFIENHDNPRSVSRYTDDSDATRDLGAKLLCLMTTTMGGTQYVYQGEELGMRNMPLDWPVDEWKDVEAVNYWKKMNELYPGNDAELKKAKSNMQRKARDNARLPVQWDDGPNAGFCDQGTTPWMHANGDYKTVNAAAQREFQSDDQLSVLQFWKRGLANRKENKDVFVYGDFACLDEEDENVFAYKRWSEKGDAFVVVLNFSGQEVRWSLPASAKVGKWVAGNYQKGAPEKATSGEVALKPWEGILGTASV